MSDLLELAQKTRPFIEKAAQSLSDADRLKASELTGLYMEEVEPE